MKAAFTMRAIIVLPGSAQTVLAVVGNVKNLWCISS
jgi:hypothetical protein